MTTSSTRASTQTTTTQKILHVTRKVQADFLAILDNYNYFSEEYASNLIHDVRAFLDEDVLTQVKFVWTSPGTNQVIDALVYEVVTGGVQLADNRSGGITYQTELAKATFNVRISYNDRWYKQLSEEEQGKILAPLKFRWGPSGQLDYSGGQWVADRTYSLDGYGLARNRFTRT